MERAWRRGHAGRSHDTWHLPLDTLDPRGGAVSWLGCASNVLRPIGPNEIGPHCRMGP